jgi:hypothetical protein
MSVALTDGSSYTPTRTGGRPNGVTHSATFDAPGSHELGEASMTDGLPHAAVSHAKPSAVAKGGVGLADSLDMPAVVGGAVGAEVPQDTSAVPMSASVANATVPEMAERTRRDRGTAFGRTAE